MLEWREEGGGWLVPKLSQKLAVQPSAVLFPLYCTGFAIVWAGIYKPPPAPCCHYSDFATLPPHLRVQAVGLARPLATRATTPLPSLGLRGVCVCQ